MQVTSEHIQYAEHLSPAESGPNLGYGGASFLAAIGRLAEGKPEPDTGLLLVAHVDFVDSYSDVGRVGTNGASVGIEMAEAAGKPLSHVSPSLLLTPDEAEARGWELIALAHLARSGS